MRETEGRDGRQRLRCDGQAAVSVRAKQVEHRCFDRSPRLRSRHHAHVDHLTIHVAIDHAGIDASEERRLASGPPRLRVYSLEPQTRLARSGSRP